MSSSTPPHSGQGFPWSTSSGARLVNSRLPHSRHRISRSTSIGPSAQLHSGNAEVLQGMRGISRSQTSPRTLARPRESRPGSVALSLMPGDEDLDVRQLAERHPRLFASSPTAARPRPRSGFLAAAQASGDRLHQQPRSLIDVSRRKTHACCSHLATKAGRPGTRSMDASLLGSASLGERSISRAPPAGRSAAPGLPRLLSPAIRLS
jgi:hypothetical protein